MVRTYPHSEELCELRTLSKAMWGKRGGKLLFVMCEHCANELFVAVYPQFDRINWLLQQDVDRGGEDMMCMWGELVLEFVEMYGLISDLHLSLGSFVVGVVMCSIAP